MPVLADDAAGRREAMQLRFAIELGPEHAALRPRRPRARVDVDAFHRRQIDHQPAIDDGRSGDIVAAAADGDFEVERARQLDGVGDVGDAMAAGDGGRPLVDQAVVHACGASSYPASAAAAAGP